MTVNSSQPLWSALQNFHFFGLWKVPPSRGGGRASPWATASGWPQIVNPSQVCPQSLPSASHLAIPKHWLGSGSPSKHLCTYCPKATQQSPAARPAVAWLRCCSKVGATQHQELLTKGFHKYLQSKSRRSPRRKRVWDDCFTSSSSISRSTECVRCLRQRTTHSA